jgi:hypothetical protein
VRNEFEHNWWGSLEIEGDQSHSAFQLDTQDIELQRDIVQVEKVEVEECKK